jgi:hypothetical protein
MDFGINCTGCSSLLRNKLKVVKHVVRDIARPSMDVVPLKNNKLSFQIFYYYTILNGIKRLNFIHKDPCPAIPPNHTIAL